MALKRFSLRSTLCFVYGMLIPVLALPSTHKRGVPQGSQEGSSTLPKPDSITPLALLNTQNGTSNPGFVPDCWPDLPGPGPKAPPITHPPDCGEAIQEMFAEAPSWEEEVWAARRSWTHQSCGLFLIPMYGIRTPRDTFSRLEIAREASAIQIVCVNDAHGLRGGAVPIGIGVFEVALMGRPDVPGLEEDSQDKVANVTAVEKRALPLQSRPEIPSPADVSIHGNVSTPRNTNASLGQLPYCWPPFPSPFGHDPITQPSDCGLAILQIIQEGSSVEPIVWEGRSRWTSGSCVLTLEPDSTYSLDRFSRLDIARAASQVQVACVNEENDFRGGGLQIGPRKLFAVWVDAPDNTSS